MKPTDALRSFLVGSSLLAASPILYATDYYWDTNAGTGGFGTSPAGTWGTSAFWNTNSDGTGTPANTAITTADTVHFGTSTDGFSTSAQVLFNGNKSTGNITFGSANSATVVINNSGGNLTLAAASVISVNTSSGGAIAGLINGAATSLTKEGAGNLNLSGNASTYIGATIINAGTINAQQLAYASSASSLGNAGNTADKLVLNGGTLNKFGTLSGTTARLFTLGDNGGGLSNTGTVENMVFSGTGSIVATGATDRTLTLGGTFSTGTGNSLAPVLADASGGGKVSVVKNGANTWSLSGATNSYSGGTTVNNGTLTMGSAGALGSTNGQLTVNGGTLDMAGNSLTVGNLTGTGGVISGTAGTRTLTIGQGNGTGGDYQGQINNGTGGTTALTKTGTGTIILSGTNGYTGATNVTGGKLSISSTGTINSTSGVTIGTASTAATTEFNYNSSTALSPAVSFATGSTGGTLSGNGTISQTVNITTGNTLAIGNGVGTMNFSGNLEIGGTYLFELNNTDNTADLGDVTGTLTLGGILDLVQLGAYTDGDKFTLIAYDGALSGLFKDSGGITDILDDTNFTDAGGSWTMNYNDTTAGLNGGTGAAYVTITAIPEPGAALLGSLGLLALLRRRRN